MEREVFDFLDSGNVIGEFNSKDNSRIILTRFRYNDKLDIIYSLDQGSNKYFSLKTPFKYSGIYDKENKKLYDVEFSVRYNLLKREYGNENYVSLENLYSKINSETNERIKGLMNEFKINKFDINEVEIAEEINDEDVIEEFIKGFTSKTLKDSFKEYSTNKEQNILDYLTDKEKFIENESKWFISENASEILKGLVISELKREKLKEIEENKKHPYHKINKIVNAIDGHKCITVNLTIDKDGIEQTFKYNADALKREYRSSYLSTWHIEKRADRDLFEESFGRGNDFYYNDITKITYGKNTIYEDDNYKSKEQEVCL